MKKEKLVIMSELERNVLQVALDHMKEHLEFLVDEECTDLEWAQKRLKACDNLQKAIK